MNFYDCHIHLDQFSSPKSALRENLYFNVKKVVSLCDSSSAFNFLTELFIDQKEVLFGVGLHPNKSYSLNELKKITNLMKYKVGIIGECGLDVLKKDNDIKNQLDNLRIQLEIAEKYEKILILHIRGAEKMILEILDSYKLKKVIFHWYSGPKKLLDKFMEKNLYFSFNKCIFYSRKYIEYIKMIPIKKLLLESDAPYKFRGIITHPSDFPNITKKIAEIKSIEEKSTIIYLNNNFESIFNF
ncbi:MAG: TatD family hydrolase [Promethearchaeota archaeon]